MNDKERKILESLSKHLGVEDVVSPGSYVSIIIQSTANMSRVSAALVFSED